MYWVHYWVCTQYILLYTSTPSYRSNSHVISYQESSPSQVSFRLLSNASGFAGRILHFLSLLDCQAAQARLATSTGAEPGCSLVSLRRFSYVWRYPALAWKHRMHMNASLFLVRFAKVLIFLINMGVLTKLIVMNLACTEYVLSMYQSCTSTMIQWVQLSINWVFTVCTKFVLLELDKRCYLSCPSI